ncbi:hypothetical protein F5Y03DRAFT_403049 [Xylaria venustula]|nr:hypothetical protein F5Y03DRAFT_403049 [Xylaria venustula]
MRGLHQPSYDNHNDQPRALARWKGEIITLIISIFLEATLIGILVSLNGKPYFENWRAPLSINTVVSILTTLSKAALMHSVGSAISQIKWVDYQAVPQKLGDFEIYDECSRGPEGAIKALFRLPRSILVLGALATVLGLGFGPFTQQLVQLQEVEIKSLNESLKIDFAVDYNTFPWQSTFNTLTKTNVASRDPGIRSAIMRGVFGIGSSPEWTCPGVCAWESTYQSIGFISSCENVTQATAKTKRCSKFGSKITCNMTTPGGVTLSTNHVRGVSTTLLDLNTTWSLDFLNTTPGAVVSSDLVKIGVFRATGRQDLAYNDAEIIGENVTECTLSLIMHQFEGIWANGTSNTFGLITPFSLGPGYWTNTQNFSGAPQGNALNSAFFYNTTAKGQHLPVTVTICQQDLINMLEFFDSSSFRSHMVSGVTSTENGAGVALLNADISTIMRFMADGMSQYVRAGTNNRKPASGFQISKVIFVNILWQWMTLPLVVYFLAIIFILSVMWKNHLGRIPLWRSSALALILHDYDKERQLLIAPDYVEIEKASRQYVTIQSD